MDESLESWPDVIGGYRRGRVPRPLREQQLLDVAEEQFVLHGYDGTSIEEVARISGVTRPIVYDHFGDKESLYIACVRRARGELEERILAATANATSARQMLELGIDAYFEFVQTRGRRWVVLFGGAQLTGAGAVTVASLRFDTVRQISALISQIAPGADPETRDAFAHGISGSAEQIAKWWLENPHLSRDQVVAHQVEFAWSGLSQLLDDDEEPGGPAG